MGSGIFSANTTIKIGSSGVGTFPATNTVAFTIPANSYCILQIITASAVITSINLAGANTYSTPATAAFCSGPIYLSPGDVKPIYASGTAANYVYIIFTNSP